MQPSDYYLYIDQLTQANSPEEKVEAEQQLMDLELSGAMRTDDYIKILEKDHPAAQMHAMTVLQRTKSQEAIEPLSRMYRNEKNVLVLSQLLNVFLDYDSGEFLNVIKEKIFPSVWKTVGRSKQEKENSKFRNHLLPASLKYIQKWGDKGCEKKINIFLSHSNSLVRMNTLRIYDSLGFNLDLKIVEEMKVNDPDRLVRELAAIMIEKKARSSI